MKRTDRKIFWVVYVVACLISLLLMRFMSLGIPVMLAIMIGAGVQLHKEHKVEDQLKGASPNARALFEHLRTRRELSSAQIYTSGETRIETPNEVWSGLIELQRLGLVKQLPDKGEKGQIAEYQQGSQYSIPWTTT